MDDLMLLVSIIAVVAMISFLILGVVKKNKEHFKKVGISLVVAIVAFTGFIITYDEEESVEVEEPAEEEIVEKKEPEVEEIEEEPEEAKEPELTTEERIEQLANEHFGQVDDFRYVEGVEEGTEYISVNAQISDNLTTNMTRKGFIMNIRDFVESIKDESFGEVYVGGYADMVDQYGNESNYEVISFSMLKETVDKINFDNISIENFENVADNINIHPSLQEWL